MLSFTTTTYSNKNFILAQIYKLLIFLVWLIFKFLIPVAFSSTQFDMTNETIERSRIKI